MTLTSDLGKLLSALAEVKTQGELDFLTGIQVAQVRLNQLDRRTACSLAFAADSEAPSKQESTPAHCCLRRQPCEGSFDGTR